ncbi:cysteine desulfurase family protein [Candidatus Vidania fulgoroideorum]
MKKIYFDNAATTKIDKSVLKKMFYYLKNNYGNYSSKNFFGMKAKKKVKEVRYKVSKILGCEPEEIIFTSGSTEANNLAIKGYVFSNEKKKTCLTFNIEHKSVLNSYKRVEKFGHEVIYLKPKKNGLYSIKKIKKIIKEKKINIISISWVNNEIGTIQKIKKIGKICKKNKIIFHVDATQAFGKIYTNIRNINLLTLSSHKIHGPQGIGLLYKDKEINLSSEIQGGDQEMNLRAGTQAIHQILGFGEAIDIAYKEINKNNKRIKKISKYILKELLKIEDVIINGSIKNRIPHNINISFGSIEGESLMMKMKNFSFSSGSACNSSKLEPSYVLTNIKVPKHMIHNSIRITIGKFNTIKEAKLLVKKINKSVKSLRNISPLWEMYKKGINIKNF